MRKAIKDNSVVLNMAISPGLILISSNMIILKEKVTGYNNVRTLATKDMRFGSNANVNYSKPKVSPQARSTTSPNPCAAYCSQKPKQAAGISPNNLVYLLGVMFVGGFMASKYTLI
jgi:hypothetical protein